MNPLTKPLRCLVLLFLLSFSRVAYTQVESPPSLALGVAGVVGQKGGIDVDLLAQIISEKQGELKQEFIKKTFFNDLENHSYVLWDFTYGTMNVLLESESKDAIKKNLLENASNLALVYGFSELYLQLSRGMCHSALDSLLLKFNGGYADARVFHCADEVAFKKISIKLHELNKYKIKVGGADLNFSAIFIDLIFEVLRNNEAVTKSLGFLNGGFQLGEGYYKSQSAYFRVKEHTDLKIPLHHLKKRIEKEVDLLMNNFILLKKVNRSGQSLESLILGYKEQLDEIKTFRRVGAQGLITVADKKALFDTLAQRTKPVYSDLQKMRTFIDPALTGRTGNTAIAIAENSEDNKELSQAIAKNLAAFTNFLAKGEKFDQFDIYYLEQSITPLLIRLVTEKGFNPAYLDLAREFDVLISYDLLSDLANSLRAGAGANLSSFSDLAGIPLSSFGGILELITRLDELDEVETYQFVLQTVQNVGELYEDRKLGLYLKTIVENLNTYTILNEEDKKVEIAVEDIITRIYEKYGNRQSGIFSLYFSVGINQSIDSDFKYQRLLTNSTTDTAKVESVGFASEKIGLKVKIIDFKWRRSFTVGETYRSRLTQQEHTVTKFRSNKPLVSDIYFVSYFSGLLYKVADLTTHDEFNDPIAGLGLGVAFFNSLDLNIGYNWPLKSGNDFFNSFEEQRIWTIGFDIKITEYLSALGKKRKEKNQ